MKARVQTSGYGTWGKLPTTQCSLYASPYPHISQQLHLSLVFFCFTLSLIHVSGLSGERLNISALQTYLILTNQGTGYNWPVCPDWSHYACQRHALSQMTRQLHAQKCTFDLTEGPCPCDMLVNKCHVL